MHGTLKIAVQKCFAFHYRLCVNICYLILIKLMNFNHSRNALISSDLLFSILSSDGLYMLQGNLIVNQKSLGKTSKSLAQPVSQIDR